MSFLKNFKKDSTDGIHPDWKTLTSEEQLEQVIQDSHKKPVGLFKHSTRCGISVRAKMILEDDWDISTDEIDFYYLDLLNFRPVSNKIADLTEVHHQSPQVIIVKDGEAIYDESHHDINVAEIREAIA